MRRGLRQAQARCSCPNEHDKAVQWRYLLAPNVSNLLRNRSFFVANRLFFRQWRGLNFLQFLVAPAIFVSRVEKLETHQAEKKTDTFEKVLLPNRHFRASLDAPSRVAIARRYRGSIC